MITKKRDLKLKDCNISREKYLELKYFCMQYEEKKEELRQSYGIKPISNDGQPHGNGTNNPTEQQGIRNTMLQSDIELIEQTAIEADERIYQYILENVTNGTPYECMDVPLSRTKFYDSRRYFFYLLAQKK